MKHKELAKFTIVLPNQYFYYLFVEVRINITVCLRPDSKIYLIVDLILNGRERWSYTSERLVIKP